MSRDWIVQVSSTTGTGTYTLGDPPLGTSYFPFRQRIADGADDVRYWVVNASRTKWEKNRGGTLTYGVSPGTDTLTRGVVESTNGDAPVSWISDDLPLRIYVVPDSDVEEGVLVGWLTEDSGGSDLLRTGARWWNAAAGTAVSWLELLRDGVDDIRTGFYDAVKQLYFPDNRRASTAVGAANKVFAAADIGGSFTFSTSGGERTATLPKGSDVKDGWHVGILGLSSANGIKLTPDAGDGIDGGADGATRTIPGAVLFEIRWSDADDRWITNYRPVFPAGTITGLTYQNGSDATNDIDIAAGGCMDSAGGYWMAMAALTKQLDATWAAGTNAGGRLSGSLADGDYNIWAIGRADSGLTDVGFETVANATPTLPAGYGIYRKIGWFKRASGSIVAFKTYESDGGSLYFAWASRTHDVDRSGGTALSTARVLDALRVPLDFSVMAKLNVEFNVNNSGVTIDVGCPDEVDAAVAASTAPLPNVGVAISLTAGSQAVASVLHQQQLHVRTDASGQIASRAAAAVDRFIVSTVGFNWSRR